MRRFFMFLFIVGVTSLLGYEIGDTVDNISFTDISFDGAGNPTYTDLTLTEITEKGKPVIIYFVDISYA